MTGISYKNEKKIIAETVRLHQGVNIITKGKDGAIITAKGMVYDARQKEFEVIDVTGAGDAFASGFMCGILNAPDDIEYAIKMAMANAKCCLSSRDSDRLLSKEENYLISSSDVVIKVDNLRLNPFLKQKMKITISAFKADLGAVGGHIKPSSAVLDAVLAHLTTKSKGILIDWRVSYTGDDIAILTSHANGINSDKVHKLAWEAFCAGAKTAQEQGLYGAGQDLLKQDFKGLLKGMGPAVAEMEFEERPAEPFMFLAADKTDPGAFNLPAYLSFCDPMHNSGLIISSRIRQGYVFRIIDTNYTDGERLIELKSPEEIYDIAVLLRDTERFTIDSIYSGASGDIAAAVSTTRLHNITGKYTGKDDPIMLIRTQKDFPGSGEILSPYSIGEFTAGLCAALILDLLCLLNKIPALPFLMAPQL